LVIKDHIPQKLRYTTVKYYYSDFDISVAEQFKCEKMTYCH